MKISRPACLVFPAPVSLFAQTVPPLCGCLTTLVICLALFADSSLAQAQGNVFSNALSLNGVNQYVSVPNGVWLSNQFTVECWVYPRNFGSWSRVMEFGDGPNTNNVLCALTLGMTGLPVFQFYNDSQSSIGLVTSSAPLPLNTWFPSRVYLRRHQRNNPHRRRRGGDRCNEPSAKRRTQQQLYRPQPLRRGWLRQRHLRRLPPLEHRPLPEQVQANLGHPLTGSESNLILYYRFDETNSTVATNSATPPAHLTTARWSTARSMSPPPRRRPWC